MLSPATDVFGNEITSIEVIFEILPESNPTHVREIIRNLRSSALGYKASGKGTTFNGKHVSLLEVHEVHVDKVDSVKQSLINKLEEFKSQGALHSYTFQ